AHIIAALQASFPAIIGPKREDICYATSNRQQAVKALAQQCSVVLVIGSINSSNSNRLREAAQQAGAMGYLIDDGSQIDPSWLQECFQVGVTAGASAPEVLVKTVIQRLMNLGFSMPQEMDAEEETVIFTLPPALSKG
ncbi:MAG: 4-hydroxy-3-methylbut-2-enyl diphosphate reductase, partial [Mariprofundales bacterium]